MMGCHDCLIWIGQTNKSVEQFLKEAEKRGVCREVPAWYSWVIPGHTRIFLAHKDRTSRSDIGSIFGFFHLHSVGITLCVDDFQIYKAIKSEVTKPHARPENYFKQIDFWQTRIPTGRLPIQLFHGRANGITTEAIDFFSDISLSCIPQHEKDWSRGYGISLNQTKLEEGRLCAPRAYGVRSSCFSFYFVDEKARRIDSYFCESLEDIFEEFRREKPGGSEEELQRELEVKAQVNMEGKIQSGLPEFQDAINLANSLKKKWVNIPKEIINFATAHGSVVVFQQPYPIFRRLPSAHFLAPLRINGDDLLATITDMYSRRHARAAGSARKKVRSHERNIKLPLCELRAPNQREKLNKEQLVAEISNKLQVNKVLGREILSEVSELITRELLAGRRVTIPRLGTFRITEKNNRKLVKFKSSLTLKRKVNPDTSDN